MLLPPPHENPFKGTFRRGIPPGRKSALESILFFRPLLCPFKDGLPGRVVRGPQLPCEIPQSGPFQAPYLRDSRRPLRSYFHNTGTAFPADRGGGISGAERSVSSAACGEKVGDGKASRVNPGPGMGPVQEILFSSDPSFCPRAIGTRGRNLRQSDL